MIIVFAGTGCAIFENENIAEGRKLFSYFCGSCHGVEGKGQVSVAKLETTDFDSVTKVPENAKFIKNIRPPSVPDSNNANLEKWYKYSFWDHYLKSHKNVFIIKTTEGNYAKMQVINFYCKKKEKRISSCYTIQYVYQGNGSKSFVKDANESRG